MLNEENKFSIVLLCKVANIVRSSYYKWLNREKTDGEKENEFLIKEIIALHEEVNGIYGYRRITMNLNRRLNKSYNHKRIYRLMTLVGIKSIIRRRKKRYVKSTPQVVAENILNREFSASKSNQKWVTDVTEFKYGYGKKAYLSAILDLYDNSIIAYVIGHRNDNQLVFKTLDLALKENPTASPMIHSDRGFQYTSYGFRRKLEAVKMTQSMSRVGRCIDNGPMEAYWGILKCEKYYLNKYNTFDELKNDIDEYIYFYNHERLQKRLNSLSPMEYRSLAA